MPARHWATCILPRAAHDGLHRGIGLHAFKDLGRKARLLQDVLQLLEEAVLLHGVAADDDEALLVALEGLTEFFHGALAVVQVAGESETCHRIFIPFCRSVPVHIWAGAGGVSASRRPWTLYRSDKKLSILF